MVSSRGLIQWTTSSCALKLLEGLLWLNIRALLSLGQSDHYDISVVAFKLSRCLFCLFVFFALLFTVNVAYGTWSSWRKKNTWTLVHETPLPQFNGFSLSAGLLLTTTFLKYRMCFLYLFFLRVLIVQFSLRHRPVSEMHFELELCFPTLDEPVKLFHTWGKKMMTKIMQKLLSHLNLLPNCSGVKCIPV